MIPVYRHPRKDEHVFGWIQDLAHLNNMSFKKFANAYLGGMAWDGTIDSVSGLNCLEGIASLRGLVYNNTLLPALAPYMEQCQQAVSIDHLLSGGHTHIYHTTTYMKVCPMCLKKDMDQGIHPYYRTWHQLKEITKCAVHGVQLLRLKKHGPLEAETLLSAEPETEDCGDIAEKIYSLFKAPAVTDCHKWHCRMPKRQRRISRMSRITASDISWIREAERTILLTNVPCALCKKPFLTHPYTEGRYNICRKCRQELGMQGTEKAILEIREDYEIIDGTVVHLQCGHKLSCSPKIFLWSGKECGCKAKKGSLRLHKMAFDDQEFTVMEYLRGETRGRRLVRIQHKACGEDFIISPTDFSRHRYCRVCRQREYGKNFMKDLRAMTGDEYDVITPEHEITSAQKSVKLRHRYCGTVYSNRARNILLGQRCPFCASKTGPAKAISAFNDCFDLGDSCQMESDSGYVRIKYPDGTTRREKAAFLIQELTRLDEPVLFPGKRIKRLNPDMFYSPKAKLYTYYRKRSENGIFKASSQDAGDLGMTQDEYWSGITYLGEQGKIKKTGARGIYRIIKEER